MGEAEAAKCLSETIHSGVVTETTTTVYVEGAWAAHLASPTICVETVPKPHQAGKIHLGAGAALTVIINKFPGAVVGSDVRCDGAPDVPNRVTVGAATVKYGVTSTLGGHAVTEQGDGTLIIGNIVIAGTAEYQAKVLADLATIASTETGRETIDGIQNSGHTVTIHEPSEPPHIAADCGFDHADPKISNGEGTDADIGYNPDAYDRHPGCTDPPDAALCHELGHADHITNGAYTPGPYERQEDGSMRDTALNEEHNNVWGQAGGPSENAYRRSRGYPQRPGYNGGPTPRDSD